MMPDPSDSSKAATRRERFGQVYAHVTRHLDAYEVALYVALATHADSSGGCTVRRQTLLDHLRWSPRTLDKWMRSLVERGLVEVAARHGSDGQRLANRYILHDNGWSPGHALRLVPPVDNSVENGG